MLWIDIVCCAFCLLLFHRVMRAGSWSTHTEDDDDDVRPALITSLSKSRPPWCAATGQFARCLRWLSVMQSRAHSSLCLSQCQQDFYSIFKKWRRKELKKIKKRWKKSDRLEKTYPGIIKCNFSLLKNHWPTNQRNASKCSESMPEQSTQWKTEKWLPPSCRQLRLIASNDSSVSYLQR